MTYIRCLQLCFMMAIILLGSTQYDVECILAGAGRYGTGKRDNTKVGFELLKANDGDVKQLKLVAWAI